LVQDAKKDEAELAYRFSLFVNLEEEDDDADAGTSQWRNGDGQGYNSWAAKAEPPPDDGVDYDVFYQRLGMQ
jgi:hypothetical protein